MTEPTKSVYTQLKATKDLTKKGFDYNGVAIFAPPRGSVYVASKAAIAKAFEGLALTYKKLL